MITTKNYFDVAKNINFSKLPESLQKGHAMAEKASKNGADWAMYENSDTIRKTLDLYFEKLGPFIEKPTQKPAKAKKAKQVKIRTNPNIPAETLKKAEKAVKTVKAAKAKKFKTPVAYHDHFTEAETVIKSFVGMNGKAKTLKAVKALLTKTNKFVIERKIRKGDPNADAVLLVQKSLTKVVKEMNLERVEVMKLEFSDNTLAVLSKFAKQSKVSPTVQLLKRFIPMQGNSPDKDKAKKLLADITKAMKDGVVQKTDTYFGYLQEAVMDLNDYLVKHFKYVPLDNPALSGLGSLPEFAGLACPGKEDCDCPADGKKEIQPATSSLSGVPKKKKAARRAAGKK